MISEKKILKIKDLAERDDFDAGDVATHYGISVSSAERYMRLAKVWDTPKTTPKILLLDIETAPSEFYGFQVGYGLTIHHYQIKEEWFMLSWAGKWLLQDDIFGDVVTSDEAVAKDDYRICQSLWDVLEEAHIIIAHNAIKFDVRKVKARFLVNNFIPYSPIQVIDTLKQSRKIADLSSHKLDYITKVLGLPQKDDTDFQLWKDCCEGKQEALDYMYKYNKSDIRALEGVYLYLRPWMTSHPNIGLYCNHEGNVCPHCGNTELDWNINHYYTPAGKYKAFRCKECDAIGRGRYNKLDKKERERLTISTAR